MTLTTSFHNAYKEKQTDPYTKSLHHSDGAPPNMKSASLTSETFQTASTTTSTGTNSRINSDVLYIKCFAALTGVNKFETQSMSQDITELVNIFCIMFDLNK